MKYLWQNEFLDAFQERVVLVTGASGFLGSHLCDALAKLGARVSGIAMTLEGAPSSPDRTNYAIDLRDQSAVRSVLKKVQPEHIFHLASLVTTSTDEKLVLPMLEHNLIASVNMFTQASEMGCRRFVHVGTSEEIRTVGPASAPTSPYAATNRAATDFAMMFKELYGLQTTVVRPALSFGPHQPADKLIPSAIRTLLAGDRPALNNPDIEFEYLFCDDVVRAFLTAALAEGAPGRVMDLHTGKKIAIRHIIDVLEDIIMGTADAKDTSAPKAFDAPITHSIDDWKPVWSLKAALAETIGWYTANQINLSGTPR